MHLIGIRKDLAERNPWLAGSLYKAFLEAKNIALHEVLQIAALNVTLPWVEAEALDSIALMGADYWRYGIAECAHEIDTLARYSHEQGLSVRRLTAEDLFAASTFELSKI
jgi:4,5-dihydroxyphthalate decarboxylase